MVNFIVNVRHLLRTGGIGINGVRIHSKGLKRLEISGGTGVTLGGGSANGTQGVTITASVGLGTVVTAGVGIAIISFVVGFKTVETTVGVLVKEIQPFSVSLRIFVSMLLTTLSVRAGALSGGAR
jgi:hypothetical protein